MEQAFIDDAIDLALAKWSSKVCSRKRFTYCVGLVQYEPLDYRVYRTMAVIQHQQKRHSLALALYHAAIGLNDKDGLRSPHVCRRMFAVISICKDEGLAEIRTGIDLMKKDSAYLSYVKRGENVLAAQAKK